MSKITLATVKSFIRKNREALLIKSCSSFDGMCDAVSTNKGAEFVPALEGDFRNDCGVKGAWFVLGGRDYFSAFDDGERTGYTVTNCCGKFILAVAVEAPALKLFAPAV
jgi:hypothetical protein